MTEEGLRMVELWDRLDAILQANAPLVYSTLNPPASEPEIVDAEAHLGVRFPEDFRAAYRCHNGQRHVGCGGATAFVTMEWYSLEKVVAQTTTAREVLEGSLNDPDWAEVMMQQGGMTPTQKVRNDWWNIGWVQLAGGNSNQRLCVDTVPGPAGKVGQVFGWCASDSLDIEKNNTDSLFDYISWLLLLLETGRIAYQGCGSLPGYWVDPTSGNEVGYFAPSAQS